MASNYGVVPETKEIRRCKREKLYGNLWGFLMGASILLLFDFLVFREAWNVYARTYSALPSEQYWFKAFVVGASLASMFLGFWKTHAIQARMDSRNSQSI